MLKIFVVSDATGETGERMLRSALVQFDQAETEIVRYGKVRSPQRLREIIGEARGQNALILHTLVSNRLRRVILTDCRRLGVDAMDLMGPVLDRLAVHLRLNPKEKPGLFRQLAEARSREIEAVEFAFRHDDGQHPEELDKAEIVLVGVSRTMKTPTSLYLAYRGWFAANVPVVAGVPFPLKPDVLPPHRVVCLSMLAERLLELRRVREKHFAIPLRAYTELQSIEKELTLADALAKKNGWQRIDVTGKSVEEVAREILDLHHVHRDQLAQEAESVQDS